MGITKSQHQFSTSPLNSASCLTGLINVIDLCRLPPPDITPHLMQSESRGARRRAVGDNRRPHSRPHLTLSSCPAAHFMETPLPPLPILPTFVPPSDVHPSLTVESTDCGRRWCSTRSRATIAEHSGRKICTLIRWRRWCEVRPARPYSLPSPPPLSLRLAAARPVAVVVLEDLISISAAWLGDNPIASAPDVPTAITIAEDRLDGRYPTDFTVPSRRAQTPVHLPKDVYPQFASPSYPPSRALSCRWTWVVPHAPSRLYVVLWTRLVVLRAMDRGVMCSRVDPDYSAPVLRWHAGLCGDNDITPPRVGVARAAHRLSAKSPARLGWKFYPF
ncbi:hypothetical protein B0H13DRAFT_2324535 [Mycena leptocephala]|nr:hypothetical protein B0H13DRAFT_2324535 [Mycena leptocephala]